jgi:hypothetical protein
MSATRVASGSRSGSGSQFDPSCRLASHVGLLEIVNQLRGLLAIRLADGLKDSSLGHAAEIVVHRGNPAGGDHVEADGAGKDIGMGECA